MKIYGLIGKHLSHSFSKQYFESKFNKEKILNSSYDLFELNSISKFPYLIKKLGDDFGGLNITIPYKKKIIQYLDGLDPIAQKTGAVNVIKKENDNLIGYNSDYFGFKYSLEYLLNNANESALILGTGGASDTVSVVLSDLNIDFQFVSINKGDNKLTYQDLDKNIITSHHLIINTTPLGMFPNIETKPDLPYQFLTNQHYLFDLVYNPSETAFLKEGKKQNSKIQNGLEMLIQQAEKAWKIWNM